MYHKTLRRYSKLSWRHREFSIGHIERSSSYGEIATKFPIPWENCRKLIFELWSTLSELTKKKKYYENGRELQFRSSWANFMNFPSYGRLRRRFGLYSRGSCPIPKVVEKVLSILFYHRVSSDIFLSIIQDSGKLL